MDNGLEGKFLVFLGASGAGKSSVLNYLLQQQAAKTGTGAAVTKEVKSYYVSTGPYKGLTLIDVPGHHDTDGNTDDEIMTLVIAELAALSRETKISGISGFIICNNLACSRVYIKDTVGTLTYHFGSEIAKSSVALLTQYDNAQKMKNTKGVPFYEDNKKEVTKQINAAKGPGDHKIPTVEWSCVNPLPGQDQRLLAELSKLPVWKFKYLDEVQKKFEEEYQRLIKDSANITLKDVDITKTDIVTVTNDEVVGTKYLGGLISSTEVVQVQKQIPVVNTVKEKRPGLKESEGYYRELAKKNVRDKITELIHKFSDEVNGV